MKHNGHKEYLTHECEMLIIEVEQDFDISNIEPIGSEKPEQDW